MRGGSSCADFGLTSGGNSDLWFPGTSPSPGDSLDYNFTLQESDRVECRTVTLRLNPDSDTANSPESSYYASIEFPVFEFGSPAWNFVPCGDGVTSSEQCNGRTCRNCINPRKRWISVSRSLDVCYRDNRHKCGSAGDEVVGTFVVPFPVVITIVNTDFPDLFGFDEGYFTAVATVVRPPTSSPTVSPSLSPSTVRPAPSPNPTIKLSPAPTILSSSGGGISDDSGSSNSAAVIASSIIGSLVVLAAASCVCLFYLVRRSNRAGNLYNSGQGQVQHVKEVVVETPHANNGAESGFGTQQQHQHQPPPAYAPSFVPFATATLVGEEVPGAVTEEPYAVADALHYK